MVFSALLYTSLSIFALGLIYKISTWFSRKIGISAKDITTSERVSAAAKGILFKNVYLTYRRVAKIHPNLQNE